MDIVRGALAEPIRRIAQNAGFDGTVVVNRVKEGTAAFGFNAATGEYGDLIKMGVIDPTKMVRTAFQHAASAASLMLTTDVLISMKPKKDAPFPFDGGNTGG